MDLARLALPLLRRLDPETAHGLTLRALRLGLGPKQRTGDDPILAQTLWGRHFPNPLGLAAGFDKDGVAVAPLLDLGFGFVEVGSVTPRPQPGNPRPRVFRLPEDRAVINRYGFNSAGVAAVAANLRAFRAGGHGGLVGVNLGKNRDAADAADDYEAGVRALADVADYIVVNVSSPNTPGLRALQGRAELSALLARVQAAMRESVSQAPPPLLLKIAPDLTAADRADIAAVVLERGLDGMIVSNTTIERPDDLCGRHRDERGGLSGRPLFRPSTRLLAEMYRLTHGRIPLIGVGGVGGGNDAFEKIRSGASLVQMYTALVFDGPGIVRQTKDELAGLLHRYGYASVSAAIGADV